MSARYFCFGNTIGVFDNGEYCPVEDFDESKFRRIINDLVLSKKFFSADLLLKEAMSQYFGLGQMRHYKGQCMTDSEFYLRWREEILEDEKFKILSSETWQKEKRKRTAARKSRIAQYNVGAIYCAKVKKKSATLKRHSD